jgi:CRP-like cAMP-binding protein
MPVTRFRSRKARHEEDSLARLRTAVAATDGPPEVVGRVLAIIDRELSARTGWEFLMVDPAQFYGVVRRLTTDKDVDRPQVAVRVWSALFMFLPPDGNEVRASRAEIAEIAECRPDDVTRVMRKLEQLRAISRRKEGRHTVYEVSPWIGTHLIAGIRDRAQAEAPRPQLVETEPG